MLKYKKTPEGNYTSECGKVVIRKHVVTSSKAKGTRNSAKETTWETIVNGVPLHLDEEKLSYAKESAERKLSEGENRLDPTTVSALNLGSPVVASVGVALPKTNKTETAPTTISVVGSKTNTTPAMSLSKSVLPAKSIARPTTAPHVVVIARAGTGKTTTLIEGLKLLKGLPTKIDPSPQQRAIWDAMLLSKDRCRSICFAAFNKTIQEELERRVPAGVYARTLHSLGFSAVRKRFGNVTVTSDRTERIVMNIVDPTTSLTKPEFNKVNPRLTSIVKELVSLCKVNILDGKPTDLDQLVNRHDVEFGERYESTPAAREQAEQLRELVYELVPQVLEKCRDVNADKSIDHDDMIWLSVVLDLPMWRNDLLLLDEAQDMNKCQQALALRCGYRIVAVGDDHQAIYGFAGADSESIPTLQKQLGQDTRGVVTLPLTVTRRCGRAIVKEANAYVADFSAHESNPDGIVKEVKYPVRNKYSGQPIPVEETYLPLVRPNDMVLCRANAPLVSQCFALLKRGTPAYILGKADVADGIVSLIRKMEVDNIPNLITKITWWAENEVQKEEAKKNPDDKKIDRINDRRDCVIALTEDRKDVDDVIRRIDDLFAKSDGAVKLCSIHKSKGLESPRVFFLAPGGFKQRRPCQQDWDWKQELNGRYVGTTRAIEELYYVF